MAAVTEEGAIHLWDVISGDEIQRFDLDIDEPGFILVQFSPDSRMLAARKEGTTFILDRTTGAELRPLVDEPGQDFLMEFSPAVQLLMTNKSPQLHIWNLATGSEIEHNVPQVGSVTDASIQFTPDGQSLILPYVDNSFLMWNLENKREIRQFSGHNADFWNLELSPDGRTRLSSSTDNTVRLWDVESGKQLRLFTSTSYSGIDFAPDGRSFAASGKGGAGVRIWSLEPTTEWNKLIYRSSEFIELSPDGQMALTKNPDSGQFQLLDLTSGQLWATIEETRPRLPTSTVYFFSDDGRKLVTVNDEDAIVRYDTSTGQLISTFSNPEGMYLVNVSYVPGTAHIFASGSGGAYLIDAENGEHLRTWPFDIEILELFAGFMEVSGDGQLEPSFYLPIFMVVSKHTSWIFKAATRFVLSPIVRMKSRRPLLSLMTDSCSAGEGIQKKPTSSIWRPGKRCSPFPLTQSVLGLAFSPDDSLLLSGSFDGTANLFDVESGNLVRTLEGSPGGIGLFVDFSPDGQHVLLNLVSENRIARLPVTISSLINEMCGRVLRDLTVEERNKYGLDDSSTCIKFEDENS